MADHLRTSALWTMMTNDKPGDQQRMLVEHVRKGTKRFGELAGGRCFEDVAFRGKVSRVSHKRGCVP